LILIPSGLACCRSWVRNSISFSRPSCRFRAWKMKGKTQDKQGLFAMNT
jgi:hypothetical protein